MEQLKRKPIDKEYLLSTFKDFDSDALSKKYLRSDNEQLHSHANKEILDKLNVSDTGELLFNGNEVGSPASATAGKSAYEIAQDNGFEGTESEWLESLKGKDGTNGTDGTDGTDGADGANGKDGMDGRSAYEIAVQNGFTGTEQEWLDSLRGEDGVSIDAYTKKESDEKFLTAPQIWTGSNQFKFGVDADGNYGYYKAGADTVTPFLSGGELGTFKIKNVSINPELSVGKSFTAGDKPVYLIVWGGISIYLTSASTTTYYYRVLGKKSGDLSYTNMDINLYKPGGISSANARFCFFTNLSWALTGTAKHLGFDSDRNCFVIEPHTTLDLIFKSKYNTGSMPGTATWDWEIGYTYYTEGELIVENAIIP